MANVDASVDHVGASTGTSAVVVGVRGGALGLGRETGQTPGSAGLRDVLVDGEDCLFFNVLNLSGELMLSYPSNSRKVTHTRKSANYVQKATLELASKALELVAPVDMIGLEVLELAQDKLEDVIADSILQLDDVLVGNNLCTDTSSNDGRTLFKWLGGGCREGSRQKGRQESSGEVHFDWIKPGGGTLM